MIYRSKAPLRLGLAGGGTDVSPYSDIYGGAVLNATIDKYAHCTIQETDNGKIELLATDLKQSLSLPSSSRLEVEDGILSLHKGVYNRVMSQFKIDKPLSFKMTTSCDVPPGSGLGTSSTMVVAILRAFAEWLSLPLGDYDMAYLAYQIERVDLGLRGGKQDQYAATFGGFNFMEFYGNDRVIVNPLRVKPWIVNEMEASLVLYYTGASRSSDKIIAEQQDNTRKKDENAVEAMHRIKESSYLMKNLILKGEIVKFAEMLGKEWENKKRMARLISNEKIDHIYDTAMKTGAYGGKISGAGGGGFMLFMIDPTKKVELAGELNSIGGDVVDFHFRETGCEGWKL
jgi:D-glycero-alpha-D-manno-heptose-7-phosphate kinase